MRILARFILVAAVLGTTLVFSGCSTTRTARATAAKPTYQFSIVESSKDLVLTRQQADELNQAVTNYLKQQGLDRDGEYYVKVNFTPDRPEEEAQWAVVRIYSIPARTYTLLAAYPGADDYYPYDYYRNGYYNPGYGSFSRYGYYDPFDYNYGGYSRPVPPRDHNHNKPDKPGDKPDHPPVTRTRWDNTPRPNPDQPRPNAYPPRTANPERWARERSDNRDGYTRSAPTNSSSGGSSYTPPPERSYSPPEPARAEPSPQVRDESNRRATQTNEK